MLDACIPDHMPKGKLDDVEGPAVPAGLTVIDAHVHLFPPKVFAAIWRWFDAHGWDIRYRLHAEQVVEFLVSRGVTRLVALHYAHKPGMARGLNQFVADVARAHREVIPLGTVLPGEPDAEAIVVEALDVHGMRGLKLHSHVQRIAADDPRLDPIYALCAERGRPVLIHAGREPSTPAYGFDVRTVCAADRIERVLQRHPTLPLIVPHLGADEYDAYARLLDRYENLWLDTTMAIAGWLQEPSREIFPGRAARMLYGTDFPNIPYAWDRELHRALGSGMDAATREAFFAGNARRLFGG
ncbi:MAG: amidohydrolase family protein [Polyangiales bacterium]